MIKRNKGLEPDLWNLAWAPVNDFKSVELLDQFNGVPTLAIIETANEGDHLVWQVMSLDTSSVWLYVPLTARLKRRAELPGQLDEVIFNLAETRYATVAVAGEANRLFFEREFRLDPHQGAEDTARTIMSFASQALNLALDLELPASRKRLIKRARQELQQVA